ncbi:helix-turn-helix domain-containing protein [Streptomyces sp. NPDC004436]
MAPRKEIDGSASVPAFYGKELRWKREQLGLTLADTVAGSFYGVSYLSEIERAQRRMPLDLARHVDQVLCTDGFFERCCEDVRNAARGVQPEYFAPVAEMEKRARSIEEWGHALIPGLLHTAPYIRAITYVTHPLDLSDEVEAKVQDRLERGRLFDQPKRPEYWVVLHEPLLRSSLLPPQEMADQLDHVAALARCRRIVPQVLPWNAPLDPFVAHSMKLIEFDDEPSVMYTEGPYHGQLIDDPAIVKRYGKAYDRLRAAALSSEASLAMIETTAEDLRNGQQRD